MSIALGKEVETGEFGADMKVELFKKYLIGRIPSWSRSVLLIRSVR